MFEEKTSFLDEKKATRKKKYGRCSDTTTNNTQDTIRTSLIYLMQPYDTFNSYILFSTAVLSPERYCMLTGMQRFVRIETRKYHRGASVPKKIWPLPGTKYHCQRTKNRDFRQLTRVQ